MELKVLWTERGLTDLRAARPALDALVEIARSGIGNATLSSLWSSLRTFLDERLLLADAPERLMRAVETYVHGAESAWAREVAPLAPVAPGDGADLDRQVAERWAIASREAARPRFRPATVSADALAIETEETPDAVTPKQREGRYGGLFGMTVHHAIGMMLRRGDLTAQEAVRQAAPWFGLQEHLAEAAADVERALNALKAVGLARTPGPDLQLEYPVAGAWEDGQLLSGHIDLVGVLDGQACVLDFKTDAPPGGPVEQAYPGYAAQVRAYGRLLQSAGHGRVRCGLLFTADGEIRWIELAAAESKEGPEP